MIKKRAAPGAVVQRPTERVLHQAWTVPLGRHLPQFLEAQPKLLRSAALAQAEFGGQDLGQGAARALGNEGVLALELHAAAETRRWFGVLAKAHVAGGNAADGATLVVKDLGSREPRVNFHPQLRRLLAKPTAKIAQADDVFAVVAHERRHQNVGDAHSARRPEVVEAVIGHRRIDRRALRLPFGNERIEADWVDHGTG